MSNKEALMLFWHDDDGREVGRCFAVLPRGLTPRWKSHGGSPQHGEADEKAEI